MLVVIVSIGAGTITILSGGIGIIAWAQSSARIRREETDKAVEKAVREITTDRDYYRNLANQLTRELREWERR